VVKQIKLLFSICKFNKNGIIISFVSRLVLSDYFLQRITVAGTRGLCSKRKIDENLVILSISPYLCRPNQFFKQFPLMWRRGIWETKYPKREKSSEPINRKKWQKKSPAM
jgi:hypothetical protein